MAIVHRFYDIIDMLSNKVIEFSYHNLKNNSSDYIIL